MSRILVVGPPALGDALFRPPAVLHHRSDIESAPDGYDAVIVVNDGTADAVRRLRAVLELRARQPSVQLAVVSFLHQAQQGLDALVQALGRRNPQLSFEQTCELLRGEDLPVRTRSTTEAITFEYQV
jgi:hypothetical protein